MKILALAGKADKRLLAYPLMHILALAGKTLVITDDINYRRVYKGFTNNGQIHDMAVDIYPSIDQYTVQGILDLYSEDSYDYCLMITDLFRYEQADATLCICSKTKSFLGTAIEELNDTHPEECKAIISINPLDKKEWLKLKVTPLSWNSKRFEYVYNCEEQKELLPVTDKEVLSELERVYLKAIGISQKAFEKCAKRKLM